MGYAVENEFYLPPYVGEALFLVCLWSRLLSKSQDQHRDAKHENMGGVHCCRQDQAANIW